MKKTISVFMALIMLMTLCVPAVFAADALPESEHDYADSLYKVWDYALPGSDDLLVTFSPDTYVEPFADEIEISAPDGVVTVADALAPRTKTGDFIAIFDGDGEVVGLYSGDELAGKTVAVKGDSFSIALVSDGSVGAYGFKVESVEAVSDSELADLSLRRTVIIPPDLPIIDLFHHNELFVGWAKAGDEGNTVLYDADEDIVKTEGLREVWVKMVLDESEIFSFNNYHGYFDEMTGEHYYMSDDDYRMMLLQIFKNFAPAIVPASILAAVLATYPKWKWIGSCYGMAAVTALQHFGKIDVLSAQGASSVSELENTPELISTINYYQAQQASSWLTENKAYVPGDSVYKTQLQNMYASALEGNLIIFTFFESVALVSSGHSVLLTGAYTDAKGNHVFVTYDVNKPWHYRNGYTDRFIVSPDWSSVEYSGETIGACNWTDDFDQFDSFKIDGSGSITTWYGVLFEHIANVFNTLIQAIKNLFAF